MNPFLSPYDDAVPTLRDDGVEWRELSRPAAASPLSQNLAEWTLHSGVRTPRRRHARSELLFHVTAGQGAMTVGDASFAVAVGDTIRVPAGTAYSLHNGWPVPLRLLCSLSRSGEGDDTELLPAD